MVRPADIWNNPWQRRGLIAAIVIAAYAACGFLLAPWLIERTLISTLNERLALETQIGDLSLNPFSLSLGVDDLTTTEPDGQELIAFERLFVNFQLSSLFHWAWRFDEIHLIRPAVRFERLTETDSNFSELVKRWAATEAAADETSAVDGTDDNSTGEEAAAIPRLMIADLRLIEGRLAIIDQAAGEPFSTDLAPINLELAEFSTLPDHSGLKKITVHTEGGAEIGLTGSLSVNPLAITGQVRLEGTYTPMLFRYFRDELALPLTFDGGAIAARLDYRVAMNEGGDLGVHLSNVNGTLSGLNVNQPDHPHLLELGTLSLGGGSFRWPELDVKIDRIGVDNLLLRLFRDTDGGYLPGLGTPTGAAGADDGIEDVAEDAASWQIEVGEIALNGGRLIHTDTHLENGVIEISAINASLREASLEDGGTMPLAIDLTFETGGSTGLDGTLQLFPAAALTSTLTVSELALAAAQPYLSSVANITIEDGRLSLEGALSVDDQQPFRYQGDLSIESLSLIDRVQEEALFSWQLLAVDRLALTPEQIELSVLSIADPYARIEIERDGSTNIERTFVVDAERAGQAEAEAVPSSDPAFDIVIGETRISGGSANFTDLALPLPFQADVSSMEGTLSTFATNSRAASEVELRGQVNEYGALNIDGSISANDPTQATDITVDFDNVNLPRMSPYTVKFAGRTIADGRTDLTMSYRLDAGALDGNNRLLIRDLTLGEKVEQPGAMDLPLDMAVALLKDGDGNVDFSFPVTGSIDDPEFSYSGAVMTALSNVIGGIVAAPFKLLGSLVGIAPEELEHISFEPGEAVITPPQRETLSKLAEALEQRPQLLLEVPPVQNPEADRRAIAERLLEMELETLLAQVTDDEQSHTESLRAALEGLYDALPAAEPRETIVVAHTTTAVDAEADDQPTLDVPAYNAALRSALIDAREVPDLDLNALAEARLAAVHEALTALIPLPEQRFQALPIEVVDLNEDGLVQMSLNVTIAD